MVRGWCRAEAAARTGCSRSPSHSSSLLRRNVAFAARALRVASLPFAPRAAIISPASDEASSSKGGRDPADTGVDQREGLCARAHKLMR